MTVYSHDVLLSQCWTSLLNQSIVLVLTVASWPTYRFLRRQVVWHSHLLKNSPQFVVIHIVKGFKLVNEVEVGVFLEFPCFFYDLLDVGNLTSGRLPFVNPAYTSGSSCFLYCWRILSMILLACEMSAIACIFRQQFHCLCFGFLDFI